MKDRPDINDTVRDEGADAARGRSDKARIYDGKASSGPPFAPAFSDEAIALRFAAERKDELRYVSAWGKWLRWDGQRWEDDQTLYAFDRVRETCREVSRETNNMREAKRIASGKTVGAVERLARADRRLAATVDQWDRDPMLLSTPGGVVDLRSGEIRQARPDDYLTKITAVAPDVGEDACPLWLAFLDRIFAGDQEMIAFVQRMLGYCLTGLATENSLFFNYGTGQNGKSTMMETVIYIMRDYHCVMPIEALTHSDRDRHPTEIAKLHRVRLATAVETEEGRRWAESKIKVLTGGDRLTGRFMRMDFFDFDPTHKLVVSGNHKPGLRSVNEAFRQRMKMIPYLITIPVEERDDKFKEKLRVEAAGILAWIIRGCVAWRKEGLKPPQTVLDATKAYLDSQDSMPDWVGACCVVGANEFCERGALFASWKAWGRGPQPVLSAA